FTPQEEADLVAFLSSLRHPGGALLVLTTGVLVRLLCLGAMQSFPASPGAPLSIPPCDYESWRFRGSRCRAGLLRRLECLRFESMSCPRWPAEPAPAAPVGR